MNRQKRKCIQCAWFHPKINQRSKRKGYYCHFKKEFFPRDKVIACGSFKPKKNKQINTQGTEDINIITCHPQIGKVYDEIDCGRRGLISCNIYGMGYKNNKYCAAGLLLESNNNEFKYGIKFVNLYSPIEAFVIAELQATLVAIHLSLKKGAKDLKIFYRYMGIKLWAEKEWKATNSVSRSYVSYIENAMKYVNLSFEKNEHNRAKEIAEQIIEMRTDKDGV